MLVKIRPAKGFTLIELLISTAILAIVLTAVIRFTIQTNTSFRYTRALSSHNNLISEVKMSIDTEPGCTANFRNLKTPALDANTKLSISISSYDDAGKK